MIKIEKEPDDFKDNFWGAVENCFFCNKPTEYWFGEGDTPVCPACAKLHDKTELTKGET